MTTLRQLIDSLIDLEQAAPENENLEVFYRVGSSGDCGPLGNPRVTDETDECGPFDLKDDEKYIEISAGN